MYKAVTLVLENRTDIAAKLQFASKLAAMQAARLVGLYVHELDPPAHGIFSRPYLNLIALREAQELDRAKAASAKKLFLEVTKAESIDGEWRETDDLSTGHVAHFGRRTDLLIFGAHDGPAGLGSTALDVPGVIIEGGCPALILPELPQPQLPFNRVLIAWKASKEARRAIHDALPLLQEAEQVVIATVPEETETYDGDSVGEIADHLRRHGIEASVERPESVRGEAGVAILRHAAIMDANLIVAGLYGHARLTEFMLGGVSRTLLDNPRIPLFLSH